jgi:HEAT repeat protein
VPSLLPYLDDRDAGPHAIQALGVIGVADEHTVAALRRVVADPNARYRGLAASSLGSLKAVSAVPELRGALSSSDKYTRILVSRALGSLGPEAKAALPELTALMRDPDPEVSVSAMESLFQIDATQRDRICSQFEASRARYSPRQQEQIRKHCL